MKGNPLMIPVKFEGSNQFDSSFSHWGLWLGLFFLSFPKHGFQIVMIPAVKNWKGWGPWYFAEQWWHVAVLIWWWWCWILPGLLMRNVDSSLAGNRLLRRLKKLRTPTPWKKNRRRRCIESAVCKKCAPSEAEDFWKNDINFERFGATFYAFYDLGKCIIKLKTEPNVCLFARTN